MPRQSLKKVGVPFAASSPTFHTNLISLDWGLSSGAQRVVRRARAGRPPLCINNHGVNAIEDSDENSDIDSWISPTKFRNFDFSK